MKLKKLLAMVLAVMMLAACLAGCGSEPADTPTDGETGGTAADTIVIGRAYDSDNLDPVEMTGNYNIWLVNLMLEGLVQCSDDGKTIEPLLATDWTVSDDNKTYTFNLREGILFSDGTPVTAEDWVFTFERAMGLPDSYWGFVTENFESVEAPDETTFILHTKEPSAATLALVAMWPLGVQQKAYYDEVGAEGYVNGFIGTGPYMLTEWAKGESMTFTANPYYHEEGLPKTQNIIFRVIADNDSRVMQVQSGDIDAAINLSMDNLYQLSGAENVQTIATEGCETRFVAMNVENQYLSDLRVRQALALATDPTAINSVATYGYGVPSSTVLPMTSAYVDPEAKVNVRDVEGAKALLAEAGYAEGEITLELMINAGQTFEESVATLLKEQWAEIGVNVEISSVEKTTYTERLYGTDFDCVVDYWTDDTSDPYEFMNYLCVFDLCSGFDTNYAVPGIEEKNTQATSEMDPDARAQLYYEIQRDIADACIYIPICTIPYGNAVSGSVTGFVQTPLGNLRLSNMVKSAG